MVAQIFVSKWLKNSLAFTYHGMQIVLNQMIPEHNRDFASWYAAILPSSEAKLQDLAAFYQEN